MLTSFRVKSLFSPRVLFVCILLAMLLVTSCTGAKSVPKGWSGVVVSDGSLYLGAMDGRVIGYSTANNTIEWSVLLQNPASGGGFGCAPSVTAVAIYGTPTISGDLVYIAGYNGKVYAISSATQLSKEAFLHKDNKSVPKPLVASVAVANGMVYAGSSDGVVYALDAVSLDVKWQFATGDKIWSTPAESGNTVYVTSFDKKLYALNAVDGMKKWEYTVGGAIVSSPVVEGDTVYFGSLDRHFYAVNTADGSLKWESNSPAGNWYWADPIIYKGIVYVANLDGKIYSFNAQTGQTQTVFNIGGAISTSPVVAGDMLFAANEAGKIYAVNLSNNEQKMLVDLGDKIFSSMFAVDGQLYVHSNTDKLYKVDTTTGAKLELNIK